MTERTCLDCSLEIQGRKDKKFCNDSCRNNYNNRMNSDSSSLIKNINRILKKNRRIIEQLNPSGKARVRKSKLLSSGFNFSYHTNTYTTQKGSTYYFCYDKGYLSMDNEFYTLVNRQNYID